MFDLIWHLRGSIALLEDCSADAALDRIERLLDRQRKDVIEHGQNFLAFDNPIWSGNFAPNWLAMVFYDHGRFYVEQINSGRRCVRYDLRSLHAMVFRCVSAVIVAFFGSIASGITTGLKLGLVAFAWLYGMNLIQAYLRVPLAIRSAVRTG